MPVHRRLRAGAALVAVAALLAACGDDDDASETTGSTAASSTASTAAAPFDEGAYCSLVEAYFEATDIDTNAVPDALERFDLAGRLARAMVPAAPPEAREAHARLATTSERLASLLRDADPGTEEELTAAVVAFTESLSTTGDLDAETATVHAAATEHCGLTTVPPG